jgi:HSP20 family molecular chaperone IbpA
MNRIFDDFAHGFDLPMLSGGWSGGWPHVEVSETDDHVKVVAEVPGLEEKDIEVTLHNGILTLRGEKKSESQGSVYSERWHGRFERSMQLGPDVDPDRVNAAFKNGVPDDHRPQAAGGAAPSEAHPDNGRINRRSLCGARRFVRAPLLRLPHN